MPPPAGLTPASRWGAEDYVQQLFGAQASNIKTTRKDFVFRYRSPEHWIDVFRTWYGPVHKAFAALGAERANALHADLLDLIARFNESGDGTMVAPAEYLEIVVTKA